jgi:hypothetical protein
MAEDGADPVTFQGFHADGDHAVGKDPLEFRRKLMADHPKSLAVLNAVADKSGWGEPAGEGIHRGLAAEFLLRARAESDNERDNHFCLGFAEEPISS